MVCFATSRTRYRKVPPGILPYGRRNWFVSFSSKRNGVRNGQSVSTRSLSSGTTSAASRKIISFLERHVSGERDQEAECYQSLSHLRVPPKQCMMPPRNPRTSILLSESRPFHHSHRGCELLSADQFPCLSDLPSENLALDITGTVIVIIVQARSRPTRSPFSLTWPVRPNAARPHRRKAWHRADEHRQRHKHSRTFPRRRPLAENHRLRIARADIQHRRDARILRPLNDFVTIASNCSPSIWQWESININEKAVGARNV